MNDDKIRISPDALIAMIVTEAQDRELARMPSLEEMNEDFQPSEKFQRKMEALVRDTKRKAERKKRLLNVKRYLFFLFVHAPFKLSLTAIIRNHLLQLRAVLPVRVILLKFHQLQKFPTVRTFLSATLQRILRVQLLM